MNICFSSRCKNILIAAFSFIFSLLLYTTTASAQFKDLPQSEPYYPYINYLTCTNLLQGYPDGNFHPEDFITRAEMAVLLARASGLKGQIPAAPTFRDLGPDHWAYPIIEDITCAGLVKGYADGTFRPEEPVTRAEASALLLRLTKKPVPDMAIPNIVEDVIATHWAKKQIAVALDAGLFTLAAKNNFAPDAPATRAQVARGFALMLNIIPERIKVPLDCKLIPVKGEVSVKETRGEAHRVTAQTSCGAGETISIGHDSLADLNFPDGSGLRLESDTTLVIKEARGQSTILRDGSPGMVVDYLKLDLPNGRLFGILANTYLHRYEAGNTAAKNTQESGIKLAYASEGLPAGLTLAEIEGQEGNDFWWQTAFQEKVRVEVDMPFGVAGIRGTVWNNTVTPNASMTNVAEGTVQVTSNSHQSVTVLAGHSTSISSPTAPPSPPARMSTTEQMAWTEATPWVNQHANTIQNVAPVVTPPIPVTQQQTTQINDTTQPVLVAPVLPPLNQQSTQSITSITGNSGNSR